MDVLESRIHRALLEIVKETFKEEKIPEFRVIIDEMEARSMDGSWRAPRKLNGKIVPGEIHIKNMARPTKYILATSIKQTAHLCDYAVNCHRKGSNGHGELFYEIYERLWASACRLGILDKSMAYGALIGNESRASGKMLNRLNRSGMCLEPVPEQEFGKDVRIIHAYDSFDCRDRLKELGFSYNRYSRAWEKEIPESESDKMINTVSELGATPRITKLLDIMVNQTISVIGDTYRAKEILKERGFRFRDGSWEKTFSPTELRNEKEFLDDLKKTYAIKYKVSI